MKRFHVEVVAAVRGAAVHVGGFIEAQGIFHANKLLSNTVAVDGVKIISVKVSEISLRKLVPVVNFGAELSQYLHGPWIK